MTAFGTFFLPGPTEVRPEILDAMRGPMMPHRGADFETLFGEIVALLQPIFRTARPVYVSTSSATGLMEMAVRCAPPGPILSLVNGAFSERFADIARACGRDVQVVDVPWGQVVTLEQVEVALRSRRYSAVTVVHSETSTGVLTPLEPLAKLAHAHDALLLVDSVTGIAGAPVETDAWGLDFVLTGSQKALALPPGLAFAAASARYLEGAKQAEARGRYFDVLEFDAYAKRNQTPNTPALSLLYATRAQARTIVDAGIETRWARHVAMAARTEEWVMRLQAQRGISMFAAPGYRSPTVTGISLPANLRGENIVAAMARRGFVIGGGYGKLKQLTIRIGHMGDHTLDTLNGCLEELGDVLDELTREA